MKLEKALNVSYHKFLSQTELFVKILAEMQKNPLYLIIFSIFFLFGCAKDSKTEELKTTAIQLRPHQISLYQTNDTKVIMEAIMQVLKDQGFTIKVIHYDLGFVSAIKNLDKTLAENLISEDYKGALPEVLEITANLIQRKEDIKVKIHFVSKAIDQTGIVQALEMVANQDLYQQFFEKIANYIQPIKVTSIKG